MVTNALYGIGKSVYCWVFPGQESYELEGTLNNLRKAIAEKGKLALQYNFKDPHDSKLYPPLAFAVKIEDLQAVSELFDFGDDSIVYSTAFVGTILHFYMECLVDNKTPNLQLLDLLLRRIPILDRNNPPLDEGDPILHHTPLQHALWTMCSLNKFHWSLIEFLLQKGAKIANASPFEIMKDCLVEESEKPFDPEMPLLANFKKYLILERTYHPATQSELTPEEFKDSTATIRSTLMQRSKFINLSYFAEILSKYFGFFKALVRQGSFKDCLGQDLYAFITSNPALSKIISN